MIKSSIISPVRWYSDYNEQDRFSNNCDICDFELITDKTRLLPFQLRRDASPLLISKWFLRRACNEPYSDILNTNDSLFTLDSGYWTKENFTIANGKAKSTITIPSPGGALRKTGCLTTGKTYKVKLVINEISGGIVYFVTNETLNTNLHSYTSVGTYEITFTAIGTDDGVYITFNGAAGNTVTIESVNIYKFNIFSAIDGDIDLPLGSLNLFSIGSQDVIQYCGGAFNFQIPCNKYYLILEEGSNVYYSEVITVKDFIPSQSPYILLEWKNNCDLSDIIYSNESCDYWNRLYIDGVITKPEYPIKEEGETDGNERLNITFQKWEKKQSLIIEKAPEFLVDSLTAIQLHDTIKFTNSLRIKQITVSESIEIEKIESSEISYIFNDCAANVGLKMILKDKIIDSTCCTNTPIITCYTCDYTVSDFEVEDGIYFFGVYLGEFGFYILEEEEWVLHDEEGIIICVTAEDKKYYSNGLGQYYALPQILSVNTEPTGFRLFGFNHPGLGNFAQIYIVFDDTSMLNITLLPTYYTSLELEAGIFIPYTSINGLGGLVPAGSIISFYLNPKQLNCTYDQSDPITLFY
jgi:hypothetical protein